MIDEARTQEIFGYTSDELKPQSNKQIVVRCDECGVERVSPKYTIRHLCRSCAAKKRCEDLDLRERQTVALKKTWADPDLRERQSVVQVKRWTDLGERDRQSLIMKKKWADPSARAQQSIRCQNGWADPAVRKNASAAHKKQWADPAVRERQSVALKEAWSNPNLRERQSVVQTKRFQDPAQREKVREANIKRFEDPAERAKISVAGIKTWADPEYRESRSIAQKKRYENPVEREKLSAAVQGIPYDEWEGFATDSPYCPKFNEACKESNREKYDRRCFLSGVTEEDNGQKLSVHHYDMNKAHGCDGHAWKLVPLSKKLHSTSHTPIWTARIIYLLEHVWNRSGILTKGA